MLTLNLNLPEAVFAEYDEAARTINKRFGGDPEKPRIDGKTLMAFSLARHEATEICSQFELALRIVTAGGVLPNPIQK